jgi:hypothetical protein
MKTDELIATLASDVHRPLPSVDRAITIALVAAVALAFLVLTFGLGGPRAGFVADLASLRVALKMAMPISLAAAAVVLVSSVSRPTGPSTLARAMLWLPVAVATVAVGVEIATTRTTGGLFAAMIGSNGTTCLIVLPALGLAPLAVLLAAMRKGAPARPGLAGALAGLLAGSVAALAYATYCPDDSPLFVLAWYGVGISVLMLLGALAGRRLLAW